MVRNHSQPYVYLCVLDLNLPCLVASFFRGVFNEEVQMLRAIWAISIQRQIQKYTAVDCRKCFHMCIIANQSRGGYALLTP
jgi:hypothetical protein